MFENLTNKLQDALKKLRGQAVISEANIAESMKDIREALLEADVNREVADDFVSKISKECLGEAVLRSVTPGQQAVKIVYDKLTSFLGEAESLLVAGKKPTVVMMVGLHGSGKTTTSAKLSVFLKKQNLRAMLCACDVYRPAAIDQLEILGKENDIPVFSRRGEMDVCRIASDALNEAQDQAFDYLIIDTAGRLQIDTDMVQELIRLKSVVNADEILLVADAALGQQAVSVAKHFHEALSITGVVLTKMDGDARGGAAISIKQVTNCPIKFVGLGERINELDIFYPDRMASRILGMGDILSLVEKAAVEIDQEEAEKLQAKLKKNEFDLEDFLSQLRQMKKLGGLESILKFLPGGDQLANMPEMDGKQLKGMEAIICSMTKAERAKPENITPSRKNRIAKGSGTKVEEVSSLIKQFLNMKQMMKKTGLLRSMLSGNLPSTPGGFAGLGGLGGFRATSRGSNFTPPKKKRKKR